MLRPAQNSTRWFATAGALALAVLLGACAKQSQPGYYTTAHDTTETDAQAQAQGRSQARAPSQLQLGFGGTAGKQGAQAEPGVEQASNAIPRPLREPKTYLGTVPCEAGTDNCEARRISLTLAPSGEWRARTVLLGAQAQGAAPTA